MKHLLITTIAAVVLVGCRSPKPPDIFIHDAAVEAKDPLVFHVTSRLHIPADDGQQGVATDGKYVYVQNTQQLFKYALPQNKINNSGLILTVSQCCRQETP